MGAPPSRSMVQPTLQQSSPIRTGFRQRHQANGCYGAFLHPSWRAAKVKEALGDLAMTAGTWPAGAGIYLAPERTHSGVAYVFKGTPNWGSELAICLPTVEAMERVCAGIREAFGNQYPCHGLPDAAVRAAWVPRRCDGVAWASKADLDTQKARHLTLTGRFGEHPCIVIIDTGATRTFVSEAWVKQHHITKQFAAQFRCASATGSGSSRALHAWVHI